MKRPTRRRKTSSRNQLDPFSPEPDKRFYYAFEAFEQRLSILRRLIQGSDALTLVIGERSSGKTTLLQRILATTDKPWKPCRVQTAGSTAVGRLPRIKQQGNPTAFLLESPNGKVILMDDAHRLTRKELRKLIRNTLIPNPASKIKRMVLFGEPRLTVNFDAVSDGLIDETALNKLYLPDITEEEAAAYIRHRLAVSGFTGKNPFTPAILKTLYRDSAGLPGRINEGATRWLRKKGFHGIPSKGKSGPTRIRFLRVAAWSAATVTAMILAGVLWQSGQTDRSPGSLPSSRQQMVRVKIQGADQKMRPRAEIDSVSPDSRQRPIPSRPTDAAVPNLSQQRLEPGIGMSAPPSPGLTAPTQPAKNRPDPIHREEWLMAQNPSNYTIQILGVRSERSLLTFVTEHRLERSGQAAYYRSRYRGRIWFPLVYGAFPTAKEARQAMAGLPNKIRSMSPWIRKMAAIQTEIRRASKP